MIRHHYNGLGRRALLKAGVIVAMGSTLPFAIKGIAADGDKLKIGIIGSGHVGSALGTVWAKAGHPVLFASRNLQHDKTLAADIGGKARAGTPEEAAAFGDVILLAVPYSAFPELTKRIGASLNGKVVINASNPFPERDGPIADQARRQGAGRFDAQAFPGALVVRAFNAIGSARMASAHSDPGKIGLPIAGNSIKAITVTSELTREVGFAPVVVGDLDVGQYLMPGTPLAGEHSPDEVRAIAVKLTAH